MDTQHLDTFLTGLKSYLDAQADARNIYNQEVALEFNPLLQFYRGETGENKFSDIIAYFLNPKEKHGQGSAFLKVFLEMEGLPCKDWEGLEWDKQDWDKAYVRREQPVNERRSMDFYIRFPDGRYGVGIEMKIWAADQKDQMRDYQAWLEEKHGNNHCIIYWQPYDEGKPSEHSLTKEERETLEKAGKYRLFSHWSHSVKLLEKWLSVCRAENVRTFLKQLLQFINHNINGERFMGQHDLIAEYLKNNPSKLALAMQVIDAQYSIRQQALKLFEEVWRNYNWPPGVRPQKMDMVVEETESNFSFELENTEIPYYLKFEWANKNFRNGDFGFCVKDGKTNEATIQFFNKHLGDGLNTDWWPWYRHWDGPYRHLSMEDLVGDRGQVFLKTMAEKIQFLLDRLNQAEAYPTQN